MAVFTESAIRRYLDRLIVILPLREESITGVGYDLSVGLFARVDPRTKLIADARVRDGATPARITLEPNTYVIVISREHVYLSSRIAATFHSKSSLAAQAVFLNSTTGDPNWKGRLIFSLYNASGNRVELDLDATFTTMVLHETKSRSKLTPKESKAVIERYVKDLGGASSKAEIVGYVLRDDEYTDEFRRRVDKVRRLADLPTPLFQMSITAVLAWDFVRKHIWGSIFILAAILFYVVPKLFPNWSRSVPALADISAIASILSAIFAGISFFRGR